MATKTKTKEQTPFIMFGWMNPNTGKIVEGSDSKRVDLAWFKGFFKVESPCYIRIIPSWYDRLFQTKRYREYVHQVSLRGAYFKYVEVCDVLNRMCSFPQKKVK